MQIASEEPTAGMDICEPHGADPMVSKESDAVRNAGLVILQAFRELHESIKKKDCAEEKKTDLMRMIQQHEENSSGVMRTDEPEQSSETPYEKPVKKEKIVNAPLTAYIYFSNQNRARIQRANPGASFGDIGRIMGHEWRHLPPEEKAEIKKQSWLAWDASPVWCKQVRDAFAQWAGEAQVAPEAWVDPFIPLEHYSPTGILGNMTIREFTRMKKRFDHKHSVASFTSGDAFAEELWTACLDAHKFPGREEDWVDSLYGIDPECEVVFNKNILDPKREVVFNGTFFVSGKSV